LDLILQTTKVKRKIKMENMTQQIKVVSLQRNDDQVDYIVEEFGGERRVFNWSIAQHKLEIVGYGLVVHQGITDGAETVLAEIKKIVASDIKADVFRAFGNAEGLNEVVAEVSDFIVDFVRDGVKKGLQEIDDGNL
jgi:hypothetical protein